MTERKPHPDNELIDEMTEFDTPGQQSSSGGEVNRLVGKRSEKERATDPHSRERAFGSDNPEEDAAKGPKTLAAIQKARNNS